MVEPRIYVSLLYCSSSLFYFHGFFLLLRDPIFLTPSINFSIGLSQLTGVLNFLLYKASNGLIFNES
jgi:hypothetical protein